MVVCGEDVLTSFTEGRTLHSDVVMPHDYHMQCAVMPDIILTAL